MVRSWYRATAAWMQKRNYHDPVHLTRARGVFPNDADILFLSGCEREEYARPDTQAAARAAVLPDGITLDIRSEREELGQAEAFFRRALALKPDAPEARLRLGRVLLLRGRYKEAADELRLRDHVRRRRSPPLLRRAVSRRRGRGAGRLRRCERCVCEGRRSCTLARKRPVWR